mgnify:CR=1 FL=1
MGELYTSNMAALLSAGADAMDNLFEVSFRPPISWGISDEDIKLLTLRTENFTPPAPKRSVVNIPYQTTTLQKPGSSIELQRQLSLRVRLDQGFTVYNLLAKLRDKSFNGSSVARVSNEEENMEILVNSYGVDYSGIKESTTNHQWTFYDVVVVGVKITEYEHDNQANPLEATVDLIYSSYSE